MLAERKAIGQRRTEAAEKRGKGFKAHELNDELPATEPTPERAAELADEFHRRLAELPDELERQIATRRLQGFSNQEIASALEVGLRTVERKVGLIRRTWQAQADTD
jgi:DNA-directed RNA polymerase specialized sigma24 family protein